MTAARIKEIRDRWAKATKGPMVQWAGQGWPESWASMLGIPSDQTGIGWPVRVVDTSNTTKLPVLMASMPQDQAFAACAYDDIPWLCEQVERLDGELDEARRVWMRYAARYEIPECDEGRPSPEEYERMAKYEAVAHFGAEEADRLFPEEE